ncbi:MAG: hypothetical protein HFJ28_04055 [Clostridia bacterium]|jgi:uncharacterized protein YneF (UPF0154 family)|nr:hypothetical protein [Clostridia bacterium]
MKERKTLKEIYSQHKDAVQIAILIIFAIASFIGGYLVSWNFMEKPLNDSQFKLCEQVARDIYAQKRSVIVEVPKNFSVSMTATTITVQSANKLYRGKVIAKLQNSELVMTRDMETREAVFWSILMGILFILVAILMFEGVCKIYQKVKKNSEK